MLINLLSKNIVNSLYNDFFAKADIPQIKCVIENLSNLIYNNSKKAEYYQKLNEFLMASYKIMQKIGEDERLSQTYQKSDNYLPNTSFTLPSKTATNHSTESVRSDLYKLYSVLKIFTRLIDVFSIDQMRYFLINTSHFLNRVILLNLETNNKLIEEEDEDNDVIMSTQSFSNNSNTELVVLNDCLKMFNSNELVNKIEFILNNLIQTNNGGQGSMSVNEFCLYVSQISNFITLNSRAKTHQNM